LNDGMKRRKKKNENNGNKLSRSFFSFLFSFHPEMLAPVDLAQGKAVRMRFFSLSLSLCTGTQFG